MFPGIKLYRGNCPVAHPPAEPVNAAIMKGRQAHHRKDLLMAAISRPQVVRLRSGDVVRVRPVRPGDVSALARAYAKLSEDSRYRRFFTAMPELSERILHAAAEVDHENHEALVALPLLSREIVGECRFVRLADRPDTADLAVTVADDWQGRGLGFALLARLSARALEAGIVYFTAEILAENRTMLAMLPKLGNVETEASGTVVDALIEIAEPSQESQAELLDVLAAAARGVIVGIPAPFRRLARVSDAFAHVVRLPVIALHRALLANLDAPAADDAARETPAAGDPAGREGPGVLPQPASAALCPHA
jgi:RimJ/RimL family protein N-acetyltransferase